MPTSSKEIGRKSKSSNDNQNTMTDSTVNIIAKYASSQDDNNTSANIANNPVNTESFNLNYTSDIYKSAMHSANLFDRDEINKALYNKTFRFGLLNPYGAISTSREYLFFTKPDLHIREYDPVFEDNGGLVVINSISKELGDIPFWMDLWNSRRDTTIKMLQASYDSFEDPFNHLLQNQVISNLDVPSLSSEMIDTPTNMYGVGFSYRGSSEASDDGPEFSLEFKDTRFLDTYMFFKAYEEYETLKHHGVIAPAKYYIENKILHDQFCIYKFLVDEDMETIIYYGKMYGVTPKSLPRDVFSNPNFDNGLSYSIDFKAAFYEDMKPDILGDFNKLSGTLYNNQPYQLNPYNVQLDHADTRPGVAAAVVKEDSSISPTGYVYKLKWRGSDKI